MAEWYDVEFLPRVLPRARPPCDVDPPLGHVGWSTSITRFSMIITSPVILFCRIWIEITRNPCPKLGWWATNVDPSVTMVVFQDSLRSLLLYNAINFRKWMDRNKYLNLDSKFIIISMQPLKTWLRSSRPDQELSAAQPMLRKLKWSYSWYNCLTSR